MKTNTYKEFKNWVVTTCVTDILKEPNHRHKMYDGDTAHAIYTVWYMFKHNLTEEQVDEYIQKDIEQSHKHFYHHGFEVHLNRSWVPEESQVDINIGGGYSWDKYSYIIGGGFFYEAGSLKEHWKRVVKTIWEYWTLKLMEETENAEH